MLRLGWLLAQLNPRQLAAAAHRPRSEPRTACRWPLVAVVLAAAEDVELAAADRAHFRAGGGRVAGRAGGGRDGLALVADYAARRPGWPAGLDALDGCSLQCARPRPGCTWTPGVVNLSSGRPI